MQSERRHHENRIYKSGRLLFTESLLSGGNQTDWILGNASKEYLKEHKSGTYTYLLLTARLDSYLADLNEQAQERFELIETQMRSAEGVTEELKRQNPMEWVRHCNNIRNRVAEIIKQELIYV